MKGRLLLPNTRVLGLVERNLAIYRHRWWVFALGLFEPVFYLAGIGVGVGSLVGSVEFGNRAVPYEVFVAPALMASAAMNGALADSMFSMFFKLRTTKVYEIVLATPVGVGDIALAEVTWALIRGAIYAAAFLGVAWLFGTVESFWGILALPGAVLIGFAFACAGCAATTFLRSWPDFEVANFVLLPVFLFSATFYPITVYPEPVRIVAELSPLTRSVDLLRSLTTGTIGPSIAIDVLYLVAMAGVGLTIASRRLASQLVT